MTWYAHYLCAALSDFLSKSKTVQKGISGKVVKMNYRKYIIILVIIISGANISFADDDFVFGPTVYERTKGSPDIFVDNFSSAEGDFILHLDNGRDGGYKISSATITLNGETIVRQNELNQNINSINKSGVVPQLP